MISITSSSVRAEVPEKWRSNNVTIFIISSWSIISALEFGTPKIKRFPLVRVQGERQRNLHLICLVINPKHF